MNEKELVIIKRKACAETRYKVGYGVWWAINLEGIDGKLLLSQVFEGDYTDCLYFKRDNEAIYRGKVSIKSKSESASIGQQDLVSWFLDEDDFDGADNFMLEEKPLYKLLGDKEYFCVDKWLMIA